MGAGGFALPPAAFVGGRKRVLPVEFVGRGEPGPLLVEIVSSDESVSLVVVVVGPGESVVSVDIVDSGVFLWEIMGPDKPDGTLMLVDPPVGGDKGADGAESDVGSTRFSTSSGCPDYSRLKLTSSAHRDGVVPCLIG